MATVEVVMRHRSLLLGLLAVWSCLVLVSAPTASACSCAPPDPPDVVFEGVVTAERSGGVAGRDYDFAVDLVVTGAADPTQTVRVATGDSAGCGIEQTLVDGARYRVEAYASGHEGKRRLFVNLCGGSAEFLAGPVERPANAEPGSGSDPLPWVLGAVAAAGTVAVVVRLRRSRN